MNQYIYIYGNCVFESYANNEMHRTAAITSESLIKTSRWNVTASKYPAWYGVIA